MKDLQTYWMVGRAIRANVWMGETVQQCLKGESLLQVTPEGEEPFYCLGIYNASKLMGVMESMVKNARASENSVITLRTGGTKVFHLTWLHRCHSESD